MGKMHIGRGQRLIINNKPCQITRKVDNEMWQVEYLASGKLETFEQKKLLELYADGSLCAADLSVSGKSMPHAEYRRSQIAWMDSLPREKQQKAIERYMYVTAVREAKLQNLSPRTLNPIIDQAHEKLEESGKDVKRPHWTTVIRWWKKFTQAGDDIRALVSRDDKKGNREKRYPREFEDLLYRAINDTYLTREKGTIQDTVDKATVLVADENRVRVESAQLPLPTWSVVKRLISAIDKYEVVLAREGREAAERKYRAAVNEIIANDVLEYVQIDHTTLDAMIIDELSLLPIGRPTVTVCIDVKSRCVLGVYIGFEPPSFVSVAQCLKHAFLPKSNIKEKYSSVKGDWIPFGVPHNLIVDNGMEFHSENLEKLCYTFGVNVEYMPRKTPWFKPHVERYLGTLNRAVAHKVPGTTFANIFDRGDYDAAKKAVMTLSTLREMIFKWIVDVYHQSPHRGLGGMTPQEVWEEKVGDLIPPIPADPNVFEGLIGGTAKRVLTHQGIEFESLRYNSEELGEIRKKHGDSFKVAIRYNPTDIGEIYIEHPETNELVRAPVVGIEKSRYAKGLSLWQHKVIREYAKEHMNRTSIEALAKAKIEVRELVEKDMFNKRMKTRSKRARYNAFDDSRSTLDENEHKSEDWSDEKSESNIPSLSENEHTDSGFVTGLGGEEIPDFPVTKSVGSNN